MITFLEKYLFWFKLGALALALLGAGWIGHHETAMAYQADIAAANLAKANAEISAVQDNQGFLINAVQKGMQNAETLLQKNAKVQTVTNTIIREIHDAQAPAIDADFPLPWRLVRMHDAAAFGVQPADLAAGIAGPDGTASDTAVSALADVIAANYDACHKAFNQIRALQADDQGVRDQYNAFAAKRNGGQP